MKNYPNIKIYLSLFPLLMLTITCKKETTNEVDHFGREKEWLRNNGGIYKSETILFKDKSGKIKTGILDWKNGYQFKNNGFDYTEVPFTFLKYSNVNIKQLGIEYDLDFSIVFRYKKGQIEGAIKVIQRNIELTNPNGNKFGNLENYHKLNGSWINTWFKESKTGILMKRKERSVTNQVKEASRLNTSLNSITNSTYECYSYVHPIYEITCYATNSANPSPNDVTCVWQNVGYDIYSYCFDTGGGTGSLEWPASGTSGSTQTSTSNIPCPGDIIKNPKIARSSSSNINGGRFGPTRKYPNGDPKYHKGLDIYALPNTPIYAAFSGTVTRVVSIYAPTFYGGPTSFGNYIEIESSLPNGAVIRMLYAHLNSASFGIGDFIQQGEQIGLSGRTGNANKGYSPHVHIQVSENGTKVNPENYISTKFSSTGVPLGTPCY